MVPFLHVFQYAFLHIDHFYEDLNSKSKLCVKHESRGVLLQRADGSSFPFHRTKAAAPISPPPQFKAQILLTGVEFLPHPCDFMWTQVSQCQVWSSTATKLFPTAAARPDARPAGLDSLLSVPWAGPDPPTAARQAHSDSAVRYSIRCNLDHLNSHVPWPER